MIFPYPFYLNDNDNSIKQSADSIVDEVEEVGGEPHHQERVENE
jgi:hypothetical protein